MNQPNHDFDNSNPVRATITPAESAGDSVDEFDNFPKLIGNSLSVSKPDLDAARNDHEATAQP